ncbi:MAG: D-tyrosyl-tRNA(Tyr) deacylase [Candidatus Nezhaarchaeota archaeon]|nr:D-tyrosyl-tRNA(Tyr) deacylase [Candidatus Nezhaarchaeota archaeon]MCX8142109.1 D-tyrosyl-tRNA(Tyr) deacylase [Candidatus Nezhaarchaeota archaeon]MDW8050110.1 D-aminoacyl-tRNA deacylase [Nitrososphaerota archaeon]
MLKARLAIICSKVDPASMNIRKKLLDILGFKRSMEKVFNEDVYRLDDVAIITIDRETIYADDIEGFVEADGLIFASRHAAESAMPAFLAHTPGNWTDQALYGGRPRSVCIAMPIHLRRAIVSLEKLRVEEGFDEWKCGLEVTHHGPYLEKTPAMFIELGSTLSEWTSERAAVIVAQAIAELLNVRNEGLVAVGFGGPHYAPQFNRVLLHEGVAISHIIPKYTFPFITEREIMLAIERSVIRPSMALVDWKGLKSNERQLVVDTCNKVRVQIRRV